MAAAAIGGIDPQARADAEALGYVVAVLPTVPGEQAPSELVELLRPAT